MTSSVTFMRWDNLFDDLENQLEAEIGVVEREVHDDVERERQAHLTLHDRLTNLVHSVLDPEPDAIELTLTNGQNLTVSIIRLGPDWCAVDVISPAVLSGHSLLPMAAIACLLPTAPQLVTSLGKRDRTEQVASGLRLADTMSLGFVLRDLARRRRTVEVHCRYGYGYGYGYGAGYGTGSDTGSDTGIYVGTLDRVGIDHCDLAEHPAETARRSRSVRGYRVVALASIALIRIL